MVEDTSSAGLKQHALPPWQRLLAAEVLEVVPLLALRVRYPPEDVGVVYAALGAYSPRAAEAPGAEAAADAGLLEAVCEVPREAVDVLAARRDEWPRAARRRRRGRCKSVSVTGGLKCED